MHYFFARTTGQPEIDARLQDAGGRWETLVNDSSAFATHELEALYPVIDPDVDIPQAWSSCFYLLSYADQVLLAFAWLHWLQHTQDEAPGFASWLLKGPGFALNHLSFLNVLTRDRHGVLGIMHGFLEAILERAGDWNGDQVTGRAIVELLTELDREYRYNVHDRELWPAVLQLL